MALTTYFLFIYLKKNGFKKFADVAWSLVVFNDF